MFCTACGQHIDREDKFCRNCGIPLPQQPFESAATAAPSTATAAPSVIAVSRSTTEMLQQPVISASPAAEDAGASPRQLFHENETNTADGPRDDASAAAKTLKCSHCGKLNSAENKFCESCGAPLSAGSEGAPAQAPDTAFSYLAGYGGRRPKSKTDGSTLTDKIAEKNLINKAPARAVETGRRKSRLPVLESLVVALLLFGAVAAVWMLRSSLPNRSAAQSSNVEVVLSPASAQVVAGNGFDFAATVSGTEDVDVTWSVEEGDTGGRVVPRGAKAEGGKVASLAVYLAPKTAGTYHLLATSKADPTKSAAAEVTVVRAAARK